MDRHDNSRSIGAAWAVFFAVLLIAVYIVAKPANSQVVPQGCGKTTAIMEFLTKEYSESPAFAGISTSGAPVLIFTNPETGTFTITLRQPGGITCMMMGGKDWTAIDQPKKGTDL